MTIAHVSCPTRSGGPPGKQACLKGRRPPIPNTNKMAANYQTKSREKAGDVARFNGFEIFFNQKRWACSGEAGWGRPEIEFVNSTPFYFELVFVLELGGRGRLAVSFAEHEPGKT